LTGEEEVSDPMGADDTMATDMDTDLDSLDSEGGEETDEFGASDAEAGGTEPEGREQRESREVFEASNRLYSKLAFNYDVFKRIYDADGDLKNVVADFDQDKIVIKTDAEAEKDPAMDYDDQGSTDVVKKMARSAMKRRQ
jgi:hypothetical protein